jgi:error-prone DNA polymerase
LALLRRQLESLGVVTSADIGRSQHGHYVHAAGIVTTRQSPSSANNVTFVTLEDETGNINLVVWQRLAESQHQALVGSQLLGVRGQVQREGQVIHVIAHHLRDYTTMLGSLTTQSRDFH